MTNIDSLSRFVDQQVTLKGWVYTIRTSKKLAFIVVRDGTGLCQCVVSKDDVSESVWDTAESLTRESSLQITGTVRKDERSVGGYELHVSNVVLIQKAIDYPITPKEHGVEFLLENRHLWLRSRRQWAAMRVRNKIVFSIHKFFQHQGFMQMDAPIFTGNVAEGPTTLFETDFFDEKAYLTQSGQLYGEAMAMAHGKIYTFGPTFRAEKSKTRRHLTEFWMVEPEMAFYDLDMNMELAESLITYIVNAVLQECREELEILERDISRLESINSPFPRLTYSEAVDLLRSDETANMLDRMRQVRENEKAELENGIDALKKESDQAKKGRRQEIDQELLNKRDRLEAVEEDLRNIPSWKESAVNKQWGEDLGGSDETVLTMQFDRPLLVYNYPAEIKAFYMKRHEEDENIALGVDLLAPEGYGEIIGGGQREDDLDTLKQRLHEHNLPEDAFQWYLDLRRYGSVPHSGFGLGLERAVAWICGIRHVRETIPFPRTLGRLYP